MDAKDRHEDLSLLSLTFILTRKKGRKKLLVIYSKI